MHLRNLFSRRIGTILVLSSLPGQGQESDSLKDPLWSPQGKMELLDPPLPLDQPWAHLTPPLEIKPAMGEPAFSDQALLVTPHDAVLMGQEPEVAYRKVQRLMAQRPMADNPAGVEGLGRAGAEALLHDARKLLHAIQEEHPEWKPDLIAREIAETDRRLERLRREARERYKAASPERNRRDRSQTKVQEPLPSPQTAEATPEKLETVPPQPEDLYRKGFQAMETGRKLLESGDLAGALDKLREAQEVFESTHKANPEWQPEIIEYRRRKIREDLNRIERMLDQTNQRGRVPSDSRERDRPSGQSPPKGERQEQPTIPESPQTGRNREVNELRRQLHKTEQALHESRRREEALRTVVRDLINQMDAPQPSPSGPLPPPPPVPFRPLPSPPSPAGPPPPPPVR